MEGEGRKERGRLVGGREREGEGGRRGEEGEREGEGGREERGGLDLWYCLGHTHVI